MRTLRDIRRWVRHTRYFLAFHTGQCTLAYLPHTVTIESASGCNLRCAMCPHSFNHAWKDGVMAMGLFTRILDEVKRYAFRVILQDRGEPLLNRQLPEMVRLCKEAGLDAGFNTNATLLTSECSERLIRSGLDLITFSFNGETAEAHDAISQSACFDRALANVLGFLEAKQRLRSPRPIARVQVLKFRGAAGERGCFDVGEAFRRRFHGLPLDTLGSMWAVNRAGESKQRSSAEIRAERFGYMPCRWLWSEAVIGWNGTVLPCCNDFSEDYAIGDVSQEPLSVIWNNERMVSLRRALVERRHTEIALCRDCDILYSVAEENTTVKRLVARMLRGGGSR